MHIEKKKGELILTLSVEQAEAVKKLAGAICHADCEDDYGLTKKQSPVIYNLYSVMDIFFEESK